MIEGVYSELGEAESALVLDPQRPLEALRVLIAESRIALPEGLPPMAAGVFGYLGYDMVRLMEELPAPKADPIGMPDAIMIRPTVIIVFDAVLDTIAIVTPVRPEAGVAPAGLMPIQHPIRQERSEVAQ